MNKISNGELVQHALRLAEEFHKDGKTKESLFCFLQIPIILSGGTAKEQKELGEETEDYEEAEDYLELLLNLATELEEQKSGCLAEICYKLLIMFDPDYLHYRFLGEFYLRQREFALAKTYLERALELNNPGESSGIPGCETIGKENEKEAREILGEICLHLGDFEYADENFSKAGDTAEILGEDRADISIQNTYLNLFDKYFTKSDFDFCIGILKRAIVAFESADNDFLAEVNTRLGNCYLGKGIVDKARLCFSRALELNSANDEAKEKLRKLEAM